VRRRAIDRRLDQPEFYRFPVVGPKRSQIIYLALEGTKNPSEELSPRANSHSNLEIAMTANNQNQGGQQNQQPGQKPGQGGQQGGGQQKPDQQQQQPGQKPEQGGQQGSPQK